MLFELNSTNSPRFEAHSSYTLGIIQEKCTYVVDVLPEERCGFVNETSDCKETQFFIDYTSFLFCVINSDSNGEFYGAVFMLLVWMGVLLILAKVIALDL